MAKYEKYRYIYPCRPKNAIPAKSIQDYDNGRFIAQPKLNGSCVTIFTNGIDVKTMNRHNQAMAAFNITKEDVINTLYKSSNNNWQVIVGEYMNKAKKDENKALFNHKFVIHDILCFDGDYLIGKSLQSRIDLMNGLYIKSELNDTLYTTESDNFYVVKTYSNDFTNIYNKIITVDCIEGLVIKRANAPLEIGLTEDNNSKTMVKSRKPEKNYRF